MSFVLFLDTFHVCDPKQLLRKARERHVFLFELYLLFSKEVKDSNGKGKYIYKNKLLVSKIIYTVLLLQPFTLHASFNE